MAVKITANTVGDTDFPALDFPVGVLGVTTKDPYHDTGRLCLRPHAAADTIQYLGGAYNSDPQGGGLRVRHLRRGEKFSIEGQ